MTDQEVFDVVTAHLLSQNEKCQVLTNDFRIRECRYRHGGLKCAIGALLPDWMYCPDMEGLDIISWLEEDQGLVAFLGRNRTLLYDLQHIHDVDAVEDWQWKLRWIAKKHRLSDEVIDKSVAATKHIIKQAKEAEFA